MFDFRPQYKQSRRHKPIKNNNKKRVPVPLPPPLPSRPGADPSQPASAVLASLATSTTCGTHLSRRMVFLATSQRFHHDGPGRPPRRRQPLNVGAQLAPRQGHGLLEPSICPTRPVSIGRLVPSVCGCMYTRGGKKKNRHAMKILTAAVNGRVRCRV